MASALPMFLMIFTQTSCLANDNNTLLHTILNMTGITTEYAPVNPSAVTILNTTPIFQNSSIWAETLKDVHFTVQTEDIKVLLNMIIMIVIFCIVNIYLCFYFTSTAKTATTTNTKVIKFNPKSTPNTKKTDKHNTAKMSPAMTSILKDCQALTQLLDMAGLDAQIKTLTVEIEKANKIFITGIGKSAIIAQRMAASLSCIGFGSEYVHAAEWVHGNFGKLGLKNKHEKNLVIAFSASGKTRELYDALKWMAHERIMRSDDGCRYNTNIFGIFCIKKQNIKQCKKCESWMGDIVDSCVYLGKQTKELIGLCPARSVIVQESFINAVMSVLHDQKQKETLDAFTISHPGGTIGTILRNK